MGLPTKAGNSVYLTSSRWGLCCSLWHKMCQFLQDECGHEFAFGLCYFGMYGL